MNHDILYGPSYSLARVKLEAGEEISAEAGAMVSMSSGVEMQTGIKGGVFSGLKRKLLGGESFFINTFRASSQGEVTFAPPLPGDIIHLDLCSSSTRHTWHRHHSSLSTRSGRAPKGSSPRKASSCSKPAAAGISSCRATAPYTRFLWAPASPTPLTTVTWWRLTRAWAIVSSGSVV